MKSNIDEGAVVAVPEQVAEFEAEQEAIVEMETEKSENKNSISDKEKSVDTLTSIIDGRNEGIKAINEIKGSKYRGMEGMEGISLGQDWGTFQLERILLSKRNKLEKRKAKFQKTIDSLKDSNSIIDKKIDSIKSN